MKTVRYILLALLAAVVIGLLCYQGFVTKDLESSDLVRGILILAGLILAMVRPRRARKVSNRKALYEKAYSDFIRNAFSEEPKLEKLFYRAVDDYNRGKPASGLAKLQTLRKDCQRSADLYAVTVFSALCCDDMQLWADAIREYQAALNLRPHSTLASNMGLCYQKSGDSQKAMDAYMQAVRIDKSNAFAHHNIAALYFRDGDYESALDYAQAALDLNDTMPQALSTAAMCCNLLGDEDGYQNYYRKAVAAGYDGSKIKNAVRALRTDGM